MAVSDAFQEFGDLARAIEDAGGSIEDVAVPDDGLLSADEARVEFGIRLPLLDGPLPGGLELDVDGATIDDGTVHLSVSVSRPVESDGSPPADDGRSDSTPERADEASATDDERPSTDAGPEDSSGGKGSDDEGGPPYRDPDRLRAVYEEHDSFPAMTEALGVDVTPQTVRRHMIEHGIHDPGTGGDGEEAGTDRAVPGGSDDRSGEDDGSSDAEGDDGEPAGPPPVTGSSGREQRADGGEAPSTADDRLLAEFDLPEGVTAADVKEAVSSARTIREVGHRLDLPRERAFRLLNALDLVDLVSGRLETADRRVSAEELDQRIRRATANGE